MTNEERWLVARYCGWSIERCRDQECVPPCEHFFLLNNGKRINVSGNEVGWWPHFPDADEIADDLPAFDTDPAQVVTMMEAMIARGKSPPSIIPVVEDNAMRRRWMVDAETVSSVEDTIPAAVFAACLACAKEKFGE